MRIQGNVGIGGLLNSGLDIVFQSHCAVAKKKRYRGIVLILVSAKMIRAVQKKSKQWQSGQIRDQE